MSSVPLECAQQGGIVTVWLNRPAQRNALDRALIDALTETLQRLGTDASVRAIILAGRGPAWCAGADLNWMRESAEASSDVNQAEALRLARLLRTLAELPKPTLARVHGAAFAGGLGLVCACDIAVASYEAQFCLSEVRIGLIPAVISPYLLRAMGHRATTRWALTAEVLDSGEALRAGIVHETVPAADLDETLAQLCANLVLGGPQALAATKQLLRDMAGQPLDGTLLTQTARRIATVRASEEGRAGVQALLARRAPPWQS